jgi:hypothetical protein
LRNVLAIVGLLRFVSAVHLSPPITVDFQISPLAIIEIQSLFLSLASRDHRDPIVVFERSTAFEDRGAPYDGVRGGSQSSNSPKKFLGSGRDSRTFLSAWQPADIGNREIEKTRC